MEGKVFEISDCNYAIFSELKDDNKIHLTNYGIFNTTIMNKSDLEILPEIPFNLENIKKICSIWNIFDENDYDTNINNKIVIYHNKKEFYIKNWDDFFIISSKYFF